MSHLLVIKRILVSAQACSDAEVRQDGREDTKTLSLISKVSTGS